jgi:uncharacterized protein (DUF4213/DUF364 family)
MLIGPSTPLSPILFEYNIGILSGILVEDERQVIKSVNQGAIFRQIQGIKRVVMIKPQFRLHVAELLS